MVISKVRGKGRVRPFVLSLQREAAPFLPLSFKRAPLGSVKSAGKPKSKGKKGPASLFLQGRGRTRPFLGVLEGGPKPFVLAKVNGRARAIVLPREMKDPTCLCLSTGGPPHLFF